METTSLNLNQEIARLLDKMPANSWHESRFEFENGFWNFEFECNHAHGTFYSKAVGSTLNEAFGAARADLQSQIEAWHKARFSDEQVDEMEVLMKNSTPVTRALIVDDDIDAALSLQAALSQLGYYAEVATEVTDLPHKIATTDADYIFLDWKLSSEINAKQVMQKTVRLIDTFSDLRKKFSLHHPKIVTHSVLAKSQVNLPHSALRYFRQYDHWQKPMSFHDIVQKAADLFLIDNSFGSEAA